MGTNRLAVGTRVGDYVLDHALPSRAHELAFRASHVMLPRQVRLVALHPTYGTPETAAQLLREACLVEALRHPGVPRIHECGRLVAGDRSSSTPWIAFELVDGPTLADTMPHRPLTMPEIIAVIRDVASILAHAHARNVIHGDVRASSIVRGGETTFLVDWCDARLATSRRRATRDTTSFGDRAPELAKWSAGAPVDVYGLGAVAREALILAGAHAAPPRLTSLIDRMLAARPEHRPTSATVAEQATRVAELVQQIEISLDETTDPAIEEVILVDLANPSGASMRWTPPLGYARHPETNLSSPLVIEPRRRR